MKSSYLKFLRHLVETPSPCGQEARGQRVWIDYVGKFVDQVENDDYGNVVATLNPGSSPRLMLAAHADEIAMMVNYIDDDGYVYVRRMGGVDPAIMCARRVLIHGRDGDVPGVIGNVPPHLKGRDGKETVPKMHELFVDLGVSSRAAAEKLVRVGDLITLADRFGRLGKKVVVARAFDNRVGLFVIAEAARQLASDQKKLKAEICIVANVMEEVGLLGARQIAYSLKPDVALITDVTHATDYPGVEKRRHGDIRLGKGPTLTHGGANHMEVVALLEKVAKAEGLSVQHESMSGSTGTDTDAVFWTRGGIPSALISLPNRYMHSPVELVHLDDVERVSRLMAGFARSLKPKQTFKVKI
ncbi:MAG: putative aminopeptidase YsdC [Verrucomicrobia subdivision 3 bacterium]|nr:putative aminopeptidase YsdC [Limisphaerales bacterium]MCS1412440.1 putative aminopeptidase YsdC [Limisphaerales bacterium]